VTREGVRVCEDKVKAVREFPVPKTIKQLRSFLGLSNFYRRFIEGYSSFTSVMTKLLQKNVEFVWTEECQIVFDQLKDKLTSAPVLAFANFELPFILTTDASDSGIGGVLSQIDKQEERPVAFLSRTLSGSERHYATTHKECLSIVLI
jgi:RNase H-like domain found in reverse transcriptase